MHSRALCLVMSVCVFMYVYVAKFKVLLLENLLLVQPTTTHLSSLSAKNGAYYARHNLFKERNLEAF